MKNVLPVIFTALLVLSLFSGCQKELNYEIISSDISGTSGGTAKYSFVSSAGNCDGIIVSGIYKKDVPLSDSNFIIIKVNVDSVGSYALATANINGVIFGASGNFTSKGAQTIKLKSSGTPVAAGNFNFIPGSNGCTFNINFAANTSGSGNAQFTLSGAPDSCTTAAVNGEYIIGNYLNTGDSVVIKVNVITTGSYSITTNSANGILFSATGTFNSAGPHTITLIGSGNPTGTGQFVFTPGSNGCKFSVKCLPQPVYYDTLSCKINGSLVNFNLQVSASNNVYTTPMFYNEADIDGGVAANAYETMYLNLGKYSGKIISGDKFDITGAQDSSGNKYGFGYISPLQDTVEAYSGRAVNTPFSVVVKELTATRIRGTFSGTATDLDVNGGKGNNKKIITEGIFNLPLR